MSSEARSEWPSEERCLNFCRRLENLRIQRYTLHWEVTYGGPIGLIFLTTGRDENPGHTSSFG